MVLYIVLNLPYMVLHTTLSPPNSSARTTRRTLAVTFFASIVPLVYFYLQHKVHRVAGGELSSLHLLSRASLLDLFRPL